MVKVIDRRSADIVALPWALQQHNGTRTLLRRSGVSLLLWAHPLDMQARSGHSERLFTPSPRIKTRAGFGRKGVGCLEFRSLDRASDEVLRLVNRSFDEAVRDLRQRIVDIREESVESPKRKRTWPRKTMKQDTRPGLLLRQYWVLRRAGYRQRSDQCPSGSIGFGLEFRGYIVILI